MLEINGRKLLLDCGLFQGRRDESYKVNRNLPFEAAQVEAVILSHAHIDHCGNLPNLVSSGYQGKIYTTHVSTELVPILLEDSARIQEADAEYLNKKNRQNGGGKPVTPIYSVEDALKVKDQLVRVEYNKDFEPIPGVTARVVEAGHILGSAAVALEIQEGKKKSTLWFSGDIGRWHLPIVCDPVLPRGADTLIMESTYGDTIHEDPRAAYENLRKAASAAIARQGKVIIPAFAVGRTQDLVYEFHRMMEAGEIPKIPIYVDSPLAVKVSDIFREHPEFFDRETHEFMQESGEKALGFDMVTYVRSVEESKAINEIKEPAIIIAASGMAESGRILHHLAHTIEDARNVILIVSYQAPNTLGRRLAEGEKQVRIFGELYNRRADVVKLSGFSAHADQGFLMQYALASRDTLKQIYLVHGEETPADVLRQKLSENGMDQVIYPYAHQSFEI